LFFSVDDKNICVCNQPESRYHKRDSESRDTEWNMVQNTYEEINPAHGKLPNGAPV
jgi:hypothetical protein